MSILILWHDRSGHAAKVVSHLQTATGAAAESIQAQKPLGRFARLLHRITGNDIALQPLQHDLRSNKLVVLCCTIPGGRVPVEATAFLRQRRTDIAALACVLIPGTMTTDISGAIEHIERLAGQMPIALLEIPVPELERRGHEVSRLWIAQRKMASFVEKLNIYRS